MLKCGIMHVVQGLDNLLKNIMEQVHCLITCTLQMYIIYA
jgi:hypothetical protein